MHLNKSHLVRLSAGFLIAASLVTPALAATGTVTSGDATLRVRTGASVGSSVVTQLQDGTQVEVLSSTSNGWYHIAHNGVNGYVSGDFLSVSDTEEIAQELYGQITVSSLNVRSGPGTSYDRVARLSRGQVVQLLEQSEGWYKIDTGYISAEYINIVDPDVATATASTKGEEVAAFARTLIGRRYVYGGNGPNGFDCSGLAKYVYAQFGITINRTASAQLNNGTAVSMSQLQPGDLVFFKKSGTGSSRASHVGVYIGGGQFVHASTARVGVIISEMNSAYYTTGFVGGRRLV